MGLQGYFGSGGSGKSRTLYMDVIRTSLEEEATNFYVIVPDQFTMQTQKELCSLHERGGITNIDVLSFTRLAHKVFDELGIQMKPLLDDTGKNLILRKVALDVEDQLVLLRRNIKRVGYIHEVKSVLSEFYQYDISSSDLEEFIYKIERKGGLETKLKDLSILYNSFQDFIKDRFLTMEELLDLFKQNVRRSELLKDSVIVLDGFTGFTPIQFRLIEELLCVSKEFYITITTDQGFQELTPIHEQDLFYLSYKTYHHMRYLAQKNSIPIRQEIVFDNPVVRRFEQNEELAFLERNLFRYQPKSYMKDCESIQINQTNRPREEVIKVARQIRKTVREQGLYYRDFGVVVGNLGDYGHIFESVFSQFEIPYFMDQNKGLLFHPMTEYIIAALDVLIYDFSYESVFRFLKTGLLDIEPMQIDLFDNFILKRGIRGLRYYEKTFVYKGMDPTNDPINQVRNELIKILKPLRSSVISGEKRVQELLQFCVDSNLEYKMEQFAKEFHEQHDPVKAKEYEVVYTQILDLFQQIMELLGSDELSNEEFSEILKAGFSELSIGRIPQNVDRVMIGDIERTRLKEVKVLFMVGVNDGVIPKTSSKGGILSDLEKELLHKNGMELAPTGRQQMFIQKLYLYLNLTKATEKIYFSYSKTDTSGKTLRPSYFISTMTALFPKVIFHTEHELRLEQIEGVQDAYCELSKLMREYASGVLSNQQERFEVFQILYKTFRGHEMDKVYEKKLCKLEKTAFLEYSHTPLTENMAKQLYGEKIRASVTRLEQFVKCGYAHFLKYGLRLQERELDELQAVDMGTLYHGVLESFDHYVRKEKISWLDWDEETVKVFVKEQLNQFAIDHEETLLFRNERYLYTLTQMERILYRTLDTIKYQLNKGKFSPFISEAGFQIEQQMIIQGRIDRIDIFEKDNQVFVKIVDYKSSIKNFEPELVYFGLQIQLPVYLIGGIEFIKNHFPNKEIIPAAALYYALLDPIVEVNAQESYESIQGKIRKELRMKGAVLADREIVSAIDQAVDAQSDVIPVGYKKSDEFTSASSVYTRNELEVITDYTKYKIQNLEQQIMGGDIELQPCFYGDNESPCTYCEYKPICRFDEKVPGFQKKRLEKIPKDEILDKMKKEIEHLVEKASDFEKGGDE